MPSRPTLIGTVGMASATHPLAAATAMAVLESGGNAVDAAVAAGFVLQVVEPDLNGPGGEVPILVWPAGADEPAVVCGQGVAPRAATVERFGELGLDHIPGSGLLPATVPGAFGGWTLALETFGTRELADVLAPALGYAEAGWPLAARTASALDRLAPDFRRTWPTSAATWLHADGSAPRAGERMRSPGLAATYRRVLTEARGAAGRAARIAAARDVFYRGFVAEEIERFCAGPPWPDATGQAHAGLLTAADCAAWQPSIEAPLHRDYRGTTVYKTDTWGQGPVFLAQLGLLEGFDLSEAGVNSADYLHLLVESAKLAFADREAFYGDPAVAGSTAVPAAELLDEGYLAERRQLIGERADLALRPGSPGGRRARLAELPDAPGQVGGHAAAALSPGLSPGLATPRAHERDTVYVAVADAAGTLVSATPSGGWLPSSPTIPALGFALGTRAQMFYLTPGLPNTLRPGARPRTTLSPSLAARDGLPWLAFGTPGGDMQDQWTLGFFLALLHGAGDLQEAIETPLVHTEHFPSSFAPRAAYPGRVRVEDGIDEDVRAELRRRGHEVLPAGPAGLGRVCAVARQDGFLHGAASPRGAMAYAVGR